MPTRSAWRLRDAIAATALFLATAAFTLWQNTRVAVLWDISFLLDTSYRFSLDQLPYKTLPFSLRPAHLPSARRDHPPLRPRLLPAHSLCGDRSRSRNPPHLAHSPRSAEASIRLRLVSRHAARNSTHRSRHLRHLPAPHLRQRLPSSPSSSPSISSSAPHPAPPSGPSSASSPAPPSCSRSSSSRTSACPSSSSPWPRQPPSPSRAAGSASASPRNSGSSPEPWSRSPPHSSPSTPPSACTTTSTGPSPSPRSAVCPASRSCFPPTARPRCSGPFPPQSSRSLSFTAPSYELAILSEP